MRKSFTLPLLAAFALAACGGNDAEEAAEGTTTSGDAAAALADAAQPEAGQYRTTTELMELNVPGAPQQAVEMMRSAFREGAAQPSTYCLTEADAAKGREKMLEGMSEGGCSVSKFDDAGRTIDAEMQCTGEGGMSGTVAMTGTMSDTGSDMVMTFDQAIPGTEGAKIKMRVKSERIGDCA